MSAQIQIPVCRPLFTGKEAQYVQEAIRSGFISSNGSFLSRLEKIFPQWVGCEHGIACCNGTAAVQLALQAAGVKKGDRVVLPSFTMMASVFPVLQLQAIPVFVDCEPDSWTLDPRQLETVTGTVKAIMPVHIYGHPCDMDPILAWARERNARVIEDAAEAHGAKYKGKMCGSIGDIAAFSFYANKVITCGEGGMVTTHSRDFADQARYFRNLCFDLDPAKRFVHEQVGFNFRMSNVLAAIAVAQMENADQLVEARRAMAAKYLERLRDCQEFLQLPCEKSWARNSYWMFGVLLKDSVKWTVAEVQKKLLEAGIETRRFFCPAHLQPALTEYRNQVRAPISERLWNRGFYLPSSSDLTDNEADYILKTLKTTL
ncbi:MAG: DegT/DnrJ/EryC1/StrS family aminotransferase [Deltaproteobacteria bacterium]|nr:DegT/DnrJ/EryC1/StrS family aminotransferase [Deltaproteobacteria bacterium]